MTTVAERKKLKVADLKALLSERGLDTSGLKAALLERLEDAIESTPARGRSRKSIPVPSPKSTAKTSSRRQSVNFQAFSPEVKAAARVPLSSDSDEGSPSPPPRRLPKGPATPHPKARPQKNASAKKGSKKGGNKKGGPSLLAALLLLAVTAAALLFGALHPERLPAPLQPHARKLTPAARAALSSAEGVLAAAAAMAAPHVVCLSGYAASLKGTWMQYHGDLSSLISSSYSSARAPFRLKSCAQGMDRAALAKAMPLAEVWQSWADRVADELVMAGAGGAESSAGERKGLTVLFASTLKGSTAAKHAADIFPACAKEGCLLDVDGAEYRHAPLATDADVAEGRGKLQAYLSGFLARCPAGVVAVTDLQAMHPGLLPALLPALSEQGAYQRGGASVPAHGATYLLHFKVPGGSFDWEAALGSEEALSRVAKEAVQAHFASDGDDAATASALALRRRIDLVGPLRSAKAKKAAKSPGMP